MAGERTNGDGWSERFSRPADSSWDETSRLEEAGNRGGGEEQAYPDEHSEKPEDGALRTDAGKRKNRGSKWENYPRRCLSPDLSNDGDRECFLNRGGRLAETDRRRNDLEWKRQRTPRRAGVAENGKTGEGGVFSNPAEQFGKKSQFNKEKWLPLARDVPLLISHYCCQKMKKQPIKHYQKKHGYKPILATLADESRVRKQAWIRHGCNAFESANPMSQPMSFWTEQDVLSYIVRYNLPIASVYGDIVSIGADGNEYPPIDVMGIPQCNLKCSGCQRTGCVYCLFGAHLERTGQERLLKLAKIEPRKYEYAIGGGQWSDNPYYDPTAPKMDGDWQNWNPKKIWTPSEKGLGLGKAIDLVNEVYGKGFIRYE